MAHNSVRIKLSPVVFICTALYICVMALGCSAKIYTPHPQIVPAFQEKGESLIGGCVGEVISIQGAYAFTNRFAMHVNYSSYRGSTTLQVGSFTFIPREDEARDMSLAAGVYYPISSHLGLEAFAGISKDKSYRKNYIYFPANGRIELQNTQYFVQPSLSWSSTHLMVALSARTSLLDFNDLIAIPSGSNDPEYSEFNDEVRELNSLSDALPFLVEPALTICTGTLRFKTQLQIGAQLTGNQDLKNQLDKFFVSVGFFGTLPSNSTQIQ
jgi:hypothetical protein